MKKFFVYFLFFLWVKCNIVMMMLVLTIVGYIVQNVVFHRKIIKLKHFSSNGFVPNTELVN